MTLSDLEKKMTEISEPTFRAKQIFEWIYQKGAASFDEMTNLSKDLRAKLSFTFRFPTLRKLETQSSRETVKFLWELSDGKQVESVLISSFDRRTVCVSSQVGCPGRCAFCASGKNGLIRSLECGEIIEQILHIDRELRSKNERVSHVVFMGMGEPMENIGAVLHAIAIINDPAAFNISQRRITISTVGVIEGIRRLTKEDLSVNLVLSLHAPNQELRQKIIPFARKYPLEKILAAMDEYEAITKREITYEYTLIKGLNDSDSEALQLADLLRGKSCTVNLIPYNPIDTVRFERPDREAIHHFRDILERHGLNVTWRYTKGDDIAAACGQLSLSAGAVKK